MSPTTLERAAGPAPSSPPPAASRPRPPRRRPSERWLLALGLLFSVLIHLLVLVLSPHFIAVGPPSTRQSAAAEPDAVPAPRGMRVYAITEVVEDAPPIEDQVETEPVEPEPLPPETPRPAPRTGEPTPDAEPGAAAPADRLAPDLHDRRLWVMPEELPTPEMTPIERVRERVYGRLEELNDSIMMAQEAQARALDWTYTDENGKRWGISPEGIHLGDLTLPGPQLTPTNGETAERVREWNELNAGADRARIRDRFNERVKAIRERKDQERAKKKGGSGSG